MLYILSLQRIYNREQETFHSDNLLEYKTALGIILHLTIYTYKYTYFLLSFIFHQRGLVLYILSMQIIFVSTYIMLTWEFIYIFYEQFLSLILILLCLYKRGVMLDIFSKIINICFKSLFLSHIPKDYHPV